MPMAVVPFGGNQFTVPSHQRIRRDQGLEFVQYLAAQHLGPSRQPTSFCIGEADPLPARVCLEHAVLFLEILDYVQLVAVDPTGDHHEQKGDEVEAAKTWRVIISTVTACDRAAPLRIRHDVVRIFGRYAGQICVTIHTVITVIGIRVVMPATAIL